MGMHWQGWEGVVSESNQNFLCAGMILSKKNFSRSLDKVKETETEIYS